MFEYLDKIKNHFDEIVQQQVPQIEKASQWLAQTLIDDALIHTFGTGHSHMVGLELFTRAGGLANVNILLDSNVIALEGSRRSAATERIPGLAKVLWDQHQIDSKDILLLISNSGRNAMPIEMAMLAKAKGLKTIAITSLEQSKKYPSRHSSGKKLG
ncbi:MAG: sugar isomerase domain-containing protein [Bacteroidota bacterium]